MCTILDNSLVVVGNPWAMSFGVEAYNYRKFDWPGFVVRISGGKMGKKTYQYLRHLADEVPVNKRNLSTKYGYYVSQIFHV